MRLRMILSSEPAEEKRRPWTYAVALTGAATAALGSSLAVLYLAPHSAATFGLAGLLLAAGGLAAAALLFLLLIVGPLRQARERLGRYAAGETDIRIDESQGIPPLRALARTFNALADRTSDRELQYALVAEATGDVIWEWTATSNRVVWTGRLGEFFGVASDRFEADSAWWHERVHPQDRELVEEGLADMACGTARHWSTEYRFRHQDGSYRWFWDRGVMIRDAKGEPQRFIGCMTDISARRKAEERIWQLANHDELTGLPNRKVFHSQLNTLTETGGENCSALLLIDIDHFKDVNDSLGHPAGDALLRAVAARLKHSAGDAAEVFRLGGDEFGILLPHSDRQASTALAARVLAALREPVIVAERVLSTRATIGIVLFPDHGNDPAELLQNADLALYEGKSRGRNQAVYFDPSLRSALERRIRLLGEVREGVAQGQFSPYYQPIVSLRTGAVQGVEALMRWQHPERGLLTPYSFLAAYDDAELALQLGTRLMECVLADFRRLEGAGLAPPYIAVNLSSAVARIPDFPDRLLGWLAEGGMPASRLGVELTETLLFGEHAELIGSMVAKLHAAGVRIALDDFGTGYASLTHLQKFPVDTIKIDQSFVRSIGTDAGSQAITSAVLELGRRLGMAVVAEGVETAEHAEILRAAGCRQAQGFHFARPMPADALVGYMAAQAEAMGTLQAKAG
jgi:diguanylate cyclase (GGDEF)-like protein/PAS domain S-box-containing protein